MDLSGSWINEGFDLLKHVRHLEMLSFAERPCLFNAHDVTGSAHVALIMGQKDLTLLDVLRASMRAETVISA